MPPPKCNIFFIITTLPRFSKRKAKNFQVPRCIEYQNLKYMVKYQDSTDHDPLDARSRFSFKKQTSLAYKD